MKKEFVITVDLGGTKILSALIDSNKVIQDRIKVPTDSKKGPDFLVECIAESITELIKKNKISNKKIRAVAMGVPGTVNPESGIISIAPNLDIKDYNIKDALQKYINLPILLENDVNMAGLGIKIFEYDNKVNNMLVVFVGTGIGGALFFNGNLYRGSSFFAGEIGHMKVNEDGSLTTDSNGSSFENIASRTAIVNSIVDRSESEKTSLSKFLDKGEKIKSKSLAKAVAANDKVVVEEMTKACGTIGTVLGSIATLLNLDTIVLGGGVIEANEDFMMEKIETAFRASVFASPGKIVKIKSTKLGDDAPLFGGIGLANEFIK
ncbi:MAG: ROK family protein [Melioribacteraceae bacterium]|nr:ROK family protein [Melioribacteraceae bacterium]